MAQPQLHLITDNPKHPMPLDDSGPESTIDVAGPSAERGLVTVGHAAENEENQLIQSGKRALSAVVLSLPKVALTSEQTLDLARYTAWLEKHSEGMAKPKEINHEEKSTGAGALLMVVCKGIESLMLWKSSCVTGTAKFSFVGMCPNPIIMVEFLKIKLDEFDFKTKKHYYKFTLPQFQEGILGQEVTVIVGYSKLVLTGVRVSLVWNAETGEYKITGTYGIPPNSCFQVFPVSKSVQDQH